MGSALAGAAALAGRGLLGLVQLDVNHPFFALLLDVLHAGQSRCHTSEELLHVVAGLRTGLNEHNAQFFGPLFPFLDGYLPLVSQIRLVAHKHDDHVTAPLCPDVINPFRSLLEGIEISDVIHHHSHCGVSDVAGDQTAEPLLPGSVPELQSNRTVFQVHGF